MKKFLTSKGYIYQGENKWDDIYVFNKNLIMIK